MISIACCEDDAITADLLENLLIDYSKQSHKSLSIKKYHTGTMLIENLSSENPFDIFFLDYYMPFKNGIDVAKELREKGEKGIVIFLTSSMDAVIDAFEVDTFRYLLKPLDAETIFRTLDQAIEKLEKSGMSYTEINTPDGVRKVKIQNIIFVEKSDRVLKYCLEDGDEIYSSTIRGSVRESVLPLLEKADFVMAGPSIAINFDSIETFSKGEIFFRNGSSLMPPRREYSALKAKWLGIEKK